MRRPESPISNEALADLLLAVGDGLLESIQTIQEMIMSDQSHLDADVTALTTVVNDFEAEVAALKAANPAVDFSKLDALVASAKAADQSTVAPTGAVATPPPAAGSPAATAVQANQDATASAPASTPASTPAEPAPSTPAEPAPAEPAPAPAAPAVTDTPPPAA